MKHIYILPLLILLSLPAMSQDTKQAADIIKKLSEKLQSLENLQADFTFTLYYPEDDFSDTQKGKLVLSDSKYRLKIMGMLVLSNGEALWSINEDSKEVYLMDPEENDLFNPQDIFELVDTDFTFSWIERKGNIAIIDMTPKSDSEYTKIRMEVDTNKNQISKATYFSIDGNQYIIGITSFIANVSIDDSFFHYDSAKFPGYSVFDMR